LSDDNKSSPSNWLWPFGPAIVILVVFPPPKVLLFAWVAAFKIFAAAGLLSGLYFGRNITNKQGRLQPKGKGILAIALLASVLLVVFVRYFHIVEDAENHFPETVVEFFASNILIGILLFLVSPAIRVVTDAFRHR